MLFYPQWRPRDGPYKKTNSYTHPPSKQQIMTLILFGAQLGLHGVFVVPSLPQIRKPILFFLLSFQIFLLLFIAYDYVRLTIKDPVDPLVLMEVVPIRKEKEGLRFCRYCQRTVQATSHHCMRCNRCTEDFDHHCKYLNNCIGSRNYEYFLRLIFIFSVYCLVGLGQAVWVFVSLENDSSLTFRNAKWGTLAAIILDSLLYLVVTVLVLFHCYINCVENTTTYGTMYPEDPEIIARKKRLETSPQQVSTRILIPSGQSM